MINTKWMPHLIAVMTFLVFGFFGFACATTDANKIEAKTRKTIIKAAGSASAELMKNLPKQGAIAVLGGDSSPNDTYATEDIEYNLVKGGYEVVDRQRLNTIRSEQQFQRSGEVMEDTAVAIGKLAGAGTVIVVSTTTIPINRVYPTEHDGLKQVITGYSGRLTVKALDVQTAQIIAMARGDLGAAGDAETKMKKNITAAADSASAELMNNLPKQGTIAVLGGDSSPNDTYAIEDFEYNLVNGGYAVGDRQRLNNIRSEQQLQRSGEVMEDTAVEIGKLAGAGTVIVVSITATPIYSTMQSNPSKDPNPTYEQVITDYSGRLTVKALDVQTAQIIAMTRGDFGATVASLQRSQLAGLAGLTGLIATGNLGVTDASSEEVKMKKNITAAADSASAELMNNLPKQGTIAVLGGDSSPNTTYAIEDIEYNLVNGEYKVGDRQRLNNIRSEQQLQLSGEVMEDTAVEIGKLAGAGTVIIVSVTTNRLTLKALDVQTGEIIVMTRGDF